MKEMKEIVVIKLGGSTLSEMDNNLKEIAGSLYIFSQCITICSPKYLVSAYGYSGLIFVPSEVGYSFGKP